MSESDNVAFARRAWDAFNRRDYSTIREFLHPEVEWRPAQGPGGIEGTVYRGLEEYEHWARDELDVLWEHYETFDLDIRDLDDRILTLGRVRGKGRGSGVEVEAPLAHLWELRDGKVAVMRAFMSREEALAAAGLC